MTMHGKGDEEVETFLVALLSGDDAVSLARDSGTTGATLRALSRLDDSLVLSRVAQNPSAPSDVLFRLAGSRDDQVRVAVADNPATPADLLDFLVLDEDDIVSGTAIEALLCRAANAQYLDRPPLTVGHRFTSRMR